MPQAPSKNSSSSSKYLSSSQAFMFLSQYIRNFKPTQTHNQTIYHPHSKPFPTNKSKHNNPPSPTPQNHKTWKTQNPIPNGGPIQKKKKKQFPQSPRLNLVHDSKSEPPISTSPVPPHSLPHHRTFLFSSLKRNTHLDTCLILSENGSVASGVCLATSLVCLARWVEMPLPAWHMVYTLIFSLGAGSLVEEKLSGNTADE